MDQMITMGAHTPRTSAAGFRWQAQSVTYHTDVAAQRRAVAQSTPANHILRRMAQRHTPPATWIESQDNPFE